MTNWARGALLGALALAACGRGSSGGREQPVSTSRPPAATAPAPDPAPVTSPATTSGPPCPDGVTARLIPVNPGNVSSLVLDLGGGGALCDARLGGATCVTNTPVANGDVDLSSDATAVVLERFTYPPAGTGTMRYSLSYQSGTATVGGTTGRVSFCGPSSGAFSFLFDPARIDPTRCSLTILLDVGRSLVPTPGGFDLVPQYRVFF